MGLNNQYLTFTLSNFITECIREQLAKIDIGVTDDGAFYLQVHPANDHQRKMLEDIVTVIASQTYDVQPDTENTILH